MGAFIVFEGGDGSGKTTLSRILCRRLRNHGYSALLTREPGGTPLGEAVRRWLKGRPGLSPATELFLLGAARAELVEKVISPALKGRQIVVCDRFTASTLAYQGYGRGLDMELINLVNKSATRGLRPDLTVLLDMPTEEGLARKGGSRRDNFETESMEFHRRVRKGYLTAAAKEPQSWLVVDWTLSKDARADRIWAKVEPLLSAKAS